MKQGLGDAGIEIVVSAPTDCDQDKGVSASADLLTAHPDVTAIYGACGPPTLCAIQSLKNAGKSAKDMAEAMKRANAAGMAIMQFGYIIDDIQYGFRSIVNNIADSFLPQRMISPPA